MNSKIITEKFNSLPYSSRVILAGMGASDQISMLLRERSCAIGLHKKNLKRINSHIKNLRESVSEIEAELQLTTEVT